MGKISLLGIQTTINDDPFLSGVGLTIFAAGCPHHCVGCHTPESWDIENGSYVLVDDIKSKIQNSVSIIKYVAFCGGEFILYNDALLQLSAFSKELGLKTILYTGYYYDQLKYTDIKYIDVIVDGPFIEAQKQAIFPASKNQRVWVDGEVYDNIQELPINKFYN